MSGERLAVVLALAACALVALPLAGGPAHRRTRRRVAARTRRMLLAGIGVGSAGAVLSMSGGMCVVLALGAALIVRWVPIRRQGLDPTGMRHLAGVLDLLAACLDAGLTVSAAITAVLRATAVARADGGLPRDGAAAHRAALAEAGALLALGADPASAWRPMESLRELAGLASAARRSSVGGVRLADAVRETAADLRRDCRVAGERGASRAGVAITAPLALCFLPAFVCLGLAPVIVGMVSTLHIW